jgi:predicted aspartyl protease
LDTGFSGSAVDTNRLAEQIIALESKIEELENANYELQQVFTLKALPIVSLQVNR